MIALLLLLSGPTLGRGFEGTVRSASTGLGMAGATVVAYDLRLNTVRVNTEADGTYVLSDLHEGGWRLRASSAANAAEAGRFLPDESEYCPGDITELSGDDVVIEDFELPVGASLTGRVVDGDGEPVPQVTLFAQGIDDFTEATARYTWSDDDGRFEIRGLDAPDDGAGSYRCSAFRESWPTQYYAQEYDQAAATPVLVTGGDPNDLGTWRLNPGVSVMGTVVDTDGKPVESATVNVFSVSQVISTTSDIAGAWSVFGVPASDEVLVWASAVGFATTYYPDNDRPTDYLSAPDELTVLKGANLILPAEAIFEGRFSGSLGGDFSDLTAVLYNDTLTIGRGVSVDSDGTFFIDMLYGGSYTLLTYAADEGYLDDYLRNREGEPVTFELVGEQINDAGKLMLPLGATLEGTVTDDSGAPVYGAYFRATNLETNKNEIVASASDGTWSMPGLTAGAWNLYAYYTPYCTEDPGYVTVYWQGQLDELQASSIHLALGDRLAGMDFVLPSDNDHDSMGDGWERENGLDPTRDDSAEDPDADGYSNLQEYILGTDPTTDEHQTVPGCSGCSGSQANNGAFVLFLPFLSFRRRQRGRGVGPRAAPEKEKPR
jgi:hypothetical protein